MIVAHCAPVSARDPTAGIPLDVSLDAAQMPLMAADFADQRSHRSICRFIKKPQNVHATCVQESMGLTDGETTEWRCAVQCHRLAECNNYIRLAKCNVS